MAGSGKRDASGKFKPGTSGNPRGRGVRADAAEPSAPARRLTAAAARLDGWVNEFTGLGDLNYDRRMSSHHETTLITWATAVDLYRGNDLAATIVDARVDDGLRRGFDLLIKDDDTVDAKPAAPGPQAKAPGQMGGEGAPLPGGKKGGPPRADALDPNEDVEWEEPATPAAPANKSKGAKPLEERITERWKKLTIVPTLKQWWKWGRAQGGSALLIGAQDGTKDWSKPLNLKKVRSLDWLTVLEARELTPVEFYANPAAPKYGKPAIYELNPQTPGQPYQGADGKGDNRIKLGSAVRIHESRLIIFHGERVSYSPLGGGSNAHGWGDSIFVRVEPVLRDFGVSWDSAATLLQDFAQATMSIEGLAELLAQGRIDVIRDRIAMVNLARSTIRTVVLDKEEVYARQQTPVGGLAELLIQFSERLAAAARMPRTRLFGTSPGGLNATGESDMRQWYDSVAADVVEIVVPALERLTEILFVLEGGAPESWSIEPRPLYQPSDQEKADSRKTQAETDAIYITNGVLSPEEVVVARFGGDRYSFETQVDLEGREALEPAAPPPAKTEQQLEQEQSERDMAMRELEIKASTKAPPAGE